MFWVAVILVVLIGLYVARKIYEAHIIFTKAVQIDTLWNEKQKYKAMIEHIPQDAPYSIVLRELIRDIDDDLVRLGIPRESLQ